METGRNTAARDSIFASSDVARKTASATLEVNEQLVYVAGDDSADVTITLPSVELAAGRTYDVHVKSVGSGSDDVVVAFPNSLTNIPGDYIMTSAGDWVRVYSDGFNYRIVATSFDPRVYKYALAGSDAAAGALSVQNPEIYDLLVTEVVVDITAPDTGTNATMDVGVDTDGTNSVNTLLDGLTTAAIDTLCMSISHGTNGDPAIWNAAGGANDYITASKATNSLVDMTGNIYIHAHKL